jgi:hypothetical protein
MESEERRSSPSSPALALAQKIAFACLPFGEIGRLAGATSSARVHSCRIAALASRFRRSAGLTQKSLGPPTAWYWALLSGSRLVLRCGLRSQSAFSSGCGLAGSAIIGWCVANISCYRGRLPSQYTHRYREAGACIHRCNGRASCTRRMWPPIQVPRGPDRCSRRRGSPSRTMAAPASGPALHLTCASLRA